MTATVETSSTPMASRDRQRPLCWSPAAPLSERVAVDYSTGPLSVLLKAALNHQIDGTEPFVCEVAFDRPTAVSALLPDGASIERTYSDSSSIHVLAACGADAHVRISIQPRESIVHVSARSPGRMERLAADIRLRFPEPIAPDLTAIRSWHMTNHDRVVPMNRRIESPRWCDIARNYTSRVRETLEQLFSASLPASGGKLILWHGEPGTGKTTALRALLREWEPWCAGQYIEDPEEFFSHPSYIAEVLSRSVGPRSAPTIDSPGDSSSIWRLVIAEDADQYLRASARRDSGAALGRLLNLADGILGQGFNTLVLLTTNEELNRLHPAIVRPGRCLARVEFDRFKPHEAQAWLPHGTSAPSGDVSLAEMYELAGEIVRLDADAPPAPISVGQYL